jgi:GntR family transcriptional regulator of arabinose operon
MRSKGSALLSLGRRQLKFQSLADELRRGILAGEWATGSKLPAETVLAAETGMSLTTVRRAYDELVAEGLVVRKQGSGSFVVRNSRSGAHRLTIGVVIPDTVLYYPRIVQGIESVQATRSLAVQLVTSHRDLLREDAAIDMLIDSAVDGILMIPTLISLENPEQRVETLASLPVPVVLMERSLVGLGGFDRSEHVCSDHVGGAHDAVAHLYALGRRRIGFVHRAFSPTAQAALQGYVNACRHLGINPHVYSSTQDNWHQVEADQALAWIQAEHIDAVLILGDREATLIQHSAAQHAISIPDDLAMVSYDDETADLATVPLTAVAPPKHRIGSLATEILLRRIQEGASSPIHQVKLRPRLNIRDSCGAAAQNREETTR